MKKSNTLIIVAGILVGLAVGFLIGTLVDYPKTDEEKISGTIRKVSNYRNAKATEADIRLQSTLVSDTVTLRMLQNYITFHYLDAIKMAGDIDMATAEANAVEDFKQSGKSQINNLTSYGLYLTSSRLYFLTALAACKDPQNTDPAVVRNTLNQVNNIISQKNYRNRSVLAFIGQVEAFMDSHPSGDFAGLKKAHDLLALNMVHASLVTGDKVMQKVLGKQALMTDFKKLSWYSQEQTMQKVRQDVEKLGTILDAEKLGTIRDAEKLSAMDAEKIGIEIPGDAEKIGIVIPQDAVKLGVLDTEKLNGCIVDAEKMGYVLFDSGKLGEIVIDSEKMGTLDVEKMGALDSEQFGVYDAEKMGIYIDVQRLGILLDAEHLGPIELIE